jgi:hypothetical protein
VIFGFSRFSGLDSSMIYVRTERHLLCFSPQEKPPTEFYLNSSGANS